MQIYGALLVEDVDEHNCPGQAVVNVDPNPEKRSNAEFYSIGWGTKQQIIFFI